MNKYDKIKEKFFMFGNKPTHELILNLKRVKLCLVVDDFEIFIRENIKDTTVGFSYYYVGGSRVKTALYIDFVDEHEIIKKIEEYINSVPKVQRWYLNSFRELKLKRILNGKYR